MAASSLYTVQLLDRKLSPPSSAAARANRAITSPASVWNTCFSVVYAGDPMLLASAWVDRSLTCARTTSAGRPLCSWSCRPRMLATWEAMPA